MELPGHRSLGIFGSFSW